MAQTRDWQGMQAMSARLLKERTGANVETWNQRIKAEHFADERALRAWLTAQSSPGRSAATGRLATARKLWQRHV